MIKTLLITAVALLAGALIFKVSYSLGRYSVHHDEDERMRSTLQQSLALSTFEAFALVRPIVGGTDHKAACASLDELLFQLSARRSVLQASEYNQFCAWALMRKSDALASLGQQDQAGASRIEAIKHAKQIDQADADGETAMANVETFFQFMRKNIQELRQKKTLR